MPPFFGARRTILLATPVPVATLGPYMPTVSATLAGVYAMCRVVGAYNGPLFQLTKPVAGTTMDVSAASGSDWPDNAAVDAWAGSETPVVSIRYDQTGGGKHETTTTAARRPTFSAIVANASGRRPAMMDAYYTPGGDYSGKDLAGPSTLTLTRTNFGAHFVIDPRLSSKNQPFLEFDTGATTDSALFTNVGLGGVCLDGTNGTPMYRTNKYLRAQVQALAVSSGGSASAVFIDGVKSAFPALPAGALGTTIKDGGSIAPGYNANTASYCTTLFASAPSDADMAAMTSWSAAAFAFPTATPIYRLAYGGSSLIEGATGTFGRTPLVYMNLPSTWDAYNFGIGGQNLSQQRANFPTAEGSVVKAGVTNVFVSDAPSNDINGTSYASAAAATSGADSYFSGTQMGLVSDAIAAGFAKVVVPTILPRSGWDTTTNFRETARLRWNANVRALSSDSRVSVSDRVSDSRLATLTSTYYASDNVHPNDAGIPILAAIDKAAILAAVTPSALSVIFDTDMERDTDDATAAAILSALTRSGAAQIAAAVTSTKAPYNGQALKALFGYAGYAPPIGTYQGTQGARTSSWAKPVADGFSFYDNTSDTNAAFPSAVTVLRQQLAASSGGVVWVTVGSLSNLSDVLKSPADEISSLTGAQLVAAKVARVCIMAANFSGTTTEYNVEEDRTAAIYVAANSPVDLYWSGFDVGGDVRCGPDQSISTSVNPYRLALTTGTADGQDIDANGERLSWDPLDVLFAVRGVSAGFTTTARGDVTINAGTGYASFAANASGKSFRVTKTGTQAALRTTLNGLIAGENRPTVVPGVPTVLIETISGTSILIAVDNATGVTGYNYRLNGGSAATLPGTRLISGLTAATAYTVEVQALRLGQASGWSSVLNVTTAAAFTPAALFAGTGDGVWLSVEPAYLYSDRAGTTLAAVDGPVGQIRDRSGNALHAVAVSDADRWTLRQSGSLYYLEGDGTKRGYLIGAVTDLNFAKTTAMFGVKAISIAAAFQTIAGKPQANGAHSDPFFRWAIIAKSDNSLAIRNNGVEALSATGQGLATAATLLTMITETGILQKAGTTVIDAADVAAVTYQNNAQCRLFSNGGGAEAFNGRFSGAVIVNRTLNNTDMSSASSYLTARLAG